VNSPTDRPAVAIEERDEVTAAIVDELWLQAIDGAVARDEVHRRVEALLERVNAQNPVVNWGMTDLHALTGSSDLSPDDLIKARGSWLTKVAEHDADPEGWMRGYFVAMLSSFSARNGAEAARAFAAKLVQQELIRGDDIPISLRP
jgi:hypothetical protein